MKTLTKPYHAWDFWDALKYRSPYANEHPQLTALYRIAQEQHDRIEALERELKATIPDAEAAYELLRRQA